MKNPFLKICLVCVFILTFLIRCEEVKSSHVNVTVTVWIRIYDSQEHKKPLVGVPVFVSIIKDGGERFEDTVVTGNDGITEITGIAFDLWREQPIVVCVTPENLPQQCSSLTWEEVDVAAEEKDNQRYYGWIAYFFYEGDAHWFG